MPVKETVYTSLIDGLSHVMDCSLPGSSVHGILQARIFVWVSFPSLGHLPDPGVKPWSPISQADSLPSEPPGKLLVMLEHIKNRLLFF